MSDLIDRHEAIDIVRNIIVKEVTPAYMLIDKAEVMTELMMMPQATKEGTTISQTHENDQDLQSTCNNLATDYISRQEAVDALEKVSKLFPWRVPGNRDSYDRYNKAWNDAIGRAEIEIEALPSAQPDLSSYSDKLWRNAYERGRAEAQAEIVKCKDCKWYELPSHKITENCVRWMKSNGILLPIKPNDYCSYAERRTDESD